MKLHHIGIVVRDLTVQGEAYARILGAVPSSPVIHDPLQKVYLQFLSGGSGAVIELIAPDSEDSPVWRDSKRGGGLNHLCYETDDLDRQLEESLRSPGAMVAREIRPAVAFGGRRVVFVYFEELGLIEFVESGSGAGQPANPT